MSKILFGWEFGGGLGHVSPISEFAHRLLRRNHEVHAITRNAYASTHAFGRLDIPCYTLPKETKPKKKKFKSSVSMAEVLYNIGYHSSAALAVKLAAWRSLFETIRPDVLILNYAPSAILAARDLSLPVLQFGTGFEVPPSETPMPGFSSSFISDVSADRLKSSEKGVVGKINRACARLGWSEIESLKEAFTTDRDMLVTLRELDHYPQRNNGLYVGPLISTPYSNPPKWPGDRKGAPRIFCYLKAKHEGTENALECLGTLDASTVVYASGLATSSRDKYATKTLRFSEKPVDLQQACRDSDIVVCHAGHGTVAAALLHGARLLLLPEKRKGEQWITAQNIQRLRAGLVIPPSNKKKHIERALDRLLNDGGRFRAEALQRQYADFNPEMPWESVVSAVEQLAD